MWTTSLLPAFYKVKGNNKGHNSSVTDSQMKIDPFLNGLLPWDKILRLGFGLVFLQKVE